jgi:NAD(P)-dependent dehydrogenase (short-subunit alcohol dehydrogenase family)
VKIRHVLITGGSSGFGWAMTERFLRDGFFVHVTTRGEGIEQVSKLPDELRGRVKVHQLDLVDASSRERLATLIRSTVPHLDILVNNAGFGLFGALEDLSEEQIRRQMEVNFTGTVLLTQALLPLLRASQGHIINFSSVLGYSGLPMTSLYCASKFALEGWSESLKYELAPYGVRVSLIQPGSHRTKFGASVEWGVRSGAAQSAFQNGSRNYRNLLEKMRTRPNSPTAESVAAKVCVAAQLKNPPFRIRCGADAHATYWARLLLPTFFYLLLSRLAFAKVFFAEPSKPSAQVRA